MNRNVLKKMAAKREPFPPPGTPGMQELIAALAKANDSVLAATEALKAWEAFARVNSKKLNGKWKKLIPKLGAAIRKMLAGDNLPAILKPLATKAADLLDRDTVVVHLGEAQQNAAALETLLSNLLLYHKSEYFNETTGIVTDVRGVIVNQLIDPAERQQVNQLSKNVLAVSDEIAQEPLDSRKANKKNGAKAVAKAEEAKINPELDAKDLELRAVRGGSITAADLTKDAAKDGNRRK